jgi:hypothetical protein
LITSYATNAENWLISTDAGWIWTEVSDTIRALAKNACNSYRKHRFWFALIPTYKGDNEMNRIRILVYRAARVLACKYNSIKLQAWAGEGLWDLRGTLVLPIKFYQFLWTVSMLMVDIQQLKKPVHWLIHKIPFHVRVKLS